MFVGEIAEHKIYNTLEIALSLADNAGWDMVRFSIDKELVREYLAYKKMMDSQMGHVYKG